MTYSLWASLISAVALLAATVCLVRDHDMAKKPTAEHSAYILEGDEYWFRLFKMFCGIALISWLFAACSAFADRNVAQNVLVLFTAPTVVVVIVYLLRHLRLR